MFESVIGFYSNLPWIIRLPVEFSISIIFLRGILASDIKTWMEDKGWIKEGKRSIIYRSLDYAYDFVAKAYRLAIPERSRAIARHYKQGHPGESVAHCGQGDCHIFAG